MIHPKAGNVLKERTVCLVRTASEYLAQNRHTQAKACGYERIAAGRPVAAGF